MQELQAKKKELTEQAGREADLFAACQAGMTARVLALLCAAAEEGGERAVAELANRPSESGFSPIHYAAYHNHSHVVGLLQRHGADLNKTDATGSTALHWACRQGCVGLVESALACRGRT